MRTVVRIKQKEFQALVQRLNLKSYKALAEKLGISRVYLSQIKNEKHQNYYPSGQLRTKILKLLQCKFDDVFQVTEIQESENAFTPKARAKKSRSKSAVA